MLVFRIEHADSGIGPYQYGHFQSATIEKILERHDNDPDRQPLVNRLWKTIPREKNRDLRSGFKRYSDMINWFIPKVLMILKRENFKIRIFSVNQRFVACGGDDNQITFDRGQARKLC